ncbi:unnamed protein product [Sphagnum balticum]
MGEQIRFAFNGYTEFVEKQIKVAEKRIRWMYCDKGDGAVSNAVYPILKEMASEQYHNALNILDKFHSRYPHDPKISQLLEKIQRMSGFLLGVVVIFIYQYLMGYVETGRWNTYSNDCEHIDNTIEGFVPFGNDDMFHEPQHLDDYEINDMVQELQHLDADEQRTDMIQEPQSVSANLEFAGPTLEENVGEGHGVFALSVDPSLSQPRCTSRITLMAPCNCIAYISDVEVFLREKWQVALFKFPASDMSRRCELEGCSEIMHDNIYLEKSGNVQELFWSNDMCAVFNHLLKHGWKQVPSSNQ